MPADKPHSPCYQMFREVARQRCDLAADETLSDVASPLPLQPDPGIQATYVGDYDYGSAILTKHVTSWVDGRNPINNASQQDAYTDRDLVGFAVTTTSPTCNSITNTQPVDFIMNLSDPVNTATVQASDFTVNGTPSNLAPTSLPNGNATITFSKPDSSPVTMPARRRCILTRVHLTALSDNMPNFSSTVSSVTMPWGR